jgi:hypothetical protein
MRVKRILFIILVSFVPLSMFAQETTSEIVGTVTDGKTPLVGATVSVLNIPTGTRNYYHP